MAKTLDAPSRPDLYERDYYSWALEPGGALCARAGLPRSTWRTSPRRWRIWRKAEARELRSRYATLVTYLLKWEFQPQRRSHSWVATLVRERDAISDHLDENPGLKPRGTSCSRRPTRPHARGRPPKATCL